MRIHLIPNSHIDPVWLWHKAEGIDEVLNTFRSACDRLAEYPHLTFSASSLRFYAWVLKFDPALFQRIRKYVAAGRWEVTGGWWIEADTNLPAEASFYKQAELSQTFVGMASLIFRTTETRRTRRKTTGIAHKQGFLILAYPKSL